MGMGGGGGIGGWGENIGYMWENGHNRVVGEVGGKGMSGFGEVWVMKWQRGGW